MNQSNQPVALVTGATGGIGLHVARTLAAAGWRVVITGRDRGRADEAVRDLGKEGNVEALVADASIVADMRSLAANVLGRTGRLDLLVNNAGGMSDVPTPTTDGIEYTLAVNFAGPYTLTRALVPELERTHGLAIAVVSSAFEMFKGDPFVEPSPHVGLLAYGRAKLLHLGFAFALARRTSVRVLAVNPGMAWTPMTAALTPRSVPQWRYVWPIVRFFQRRASPERAAAHVSTLAMSTSSETGLYFDGTRKVDTPISRDVALQDRVWEFGASLMEGSR